MTTGGGVHDADVLVVALGADYDFEATPGLLEGESEFYSIAGAERLRDVLPTFTRGAPSWVCAGRRSSAHRRRAKRPCFCTTTSTQRGVRDDCEISLVMPFATPVPPSPDTSEALLAAFVERDIEFVPDHRVASLDEARRVVVLDDGAELPYDLFLGVPKHRAPDVVLESGMAEDGYIPVDSRTLARPVPRRLRGRRRRDGRRAEGGRLLRGRGARRRGFRHRPADGGGQPERFDGKGSCYVEFGAGRVGRVDVDFLSGPKPTGTFQEPSQELFAEKKHFGASRRARWFDR